MDYHELEKLTVVKLREMAHEHTDAKATAGLKKEQLIDLLAEKLGIEKPHVVIVGVDKGKIKAAIRELKKQRAAALAGKDRKALHAARAKLHRLRRRLHKAARLT